MDLLSISKEQKWGHCVWSGINEGKDTQLCTLAVHIIYWPWEKINEVSLSAIIYNLLFWKGPI